MVIRLFGRRLYMSRRSVGSRHVVQFHQSTQQVLTHWSTLVPLATTPRSCRRRLSKLRMLETDAMRVMTARLPMEECLLSRGEGSCRAGGAFAGRVRAPSPAGEVGGVSAGGVSAFPPPRSPTPDPLPDMIHVRDPETGIYRTVLSVTRTRADCHAPGTVSRAGHGDVQPSLEDAVGVTVDELVSRREGVPRVKQQRSQTTAPSHR